MICPADKHTLISVSVRLWGQQTPVYKVSLLCDMQEMKAYLSCICSLRCLTVFILSNRLWHCLKCLLCGCGRLKPSLNRSALPSHGGGDQDVSAFLAWERRRDKSCLGILSLFCLCGSLSYSHHHHRPQHCVGVPV